MVNDDNKTVKQKQLLHHGLDGGVRGCIPISNLQESNMAVKNWFWSARAWKSGSELAGRHEYQQETYGGWLRNPAPVDG